MFAILVALLAGCERSHEEARLSSPSGGDVTEAPAAPDPTAWVRATAPELPRLWAEELARGGLSAEVWRGALEARGVKLEERTALAQGYGEGAAARFVGEQGLTPVGERLVERLQSVDLEALDPARYHVGDLPLAAEKFEAARAAFAAVTPPAAPGPEEVESIEAWARAKGLGSAEAARGLLFAADGPLPRYAEALAEAQALRGALLQRQARWELILADGLLRYARDMRRGNTATAERLARRGLEAPRPAPAEEEGPPPDEHGAASPTGEAEAPEAVEAPEAPMVLRDRKAFIVERLVADLRSVKDVASLDNLFEALVPPHPQYRRLRAALAKYREIAAAGGWGKLPAKNLSRGARGAAVTALAKRLAIEGFPVEPTATVFDEDFEAIVKRCQESHQLWPTGKVDATLRRVLDLPVEARLESITKSIDRLRRSRVDDDTYFVTINIPDFHLELWRDGERKLRHRVIVGEAKETTCDDRTERKTLAHATPVQSSEINQLVFAPYWNVTRTIKEKEYEPERGKDPLFYEKNGFELMRPGHPTAEWVRQLPGPDNALGFVKFMFPNPHATFVHDTNARSLFGRPIRALSHGCMRLDQPVGVAEALLTADGQWEAGRYAELEREWQRMGQRIKHYDAGLWPEVVSDAAKLQTIVNLKSPVPIHVEYYTARVGSDGIVEFLTDIYDYDSDRWNPKNAPRCVSERRAARAEVNDVEKTLANLEKKAEKLSERIATLLPRIDELKDEAGKNRRVIKQLRQLDGFSSQTRNLAEHIRTQHQTLSGELQKRKGKWTPHLERQAIALRRLVEGLKQTVRDADGTIKSAEAALTG